MASKNEGYVAPLLAMDSPELDTSCDEFPSDCARQAAIKILSEFWDRSFPVDVESIAESMGISVLYGSQEALGQTGRALGLVKIPSGDPGPEISGMIVKPLDGDAVILVNRDDTIERQRFTVAHELGHYFERLVFRKQSRESPISQVDFVAARVPTVLGEPDTRSEEIFADAFAHSFLMPEERLRTLWDLGYSLQELSEYFRVSEHSMANRVVQLGLE